MNLKELAFAPLTVESLAAARTAWVQQATDLDMPTLDYEKEFDWAEKHINYEAPASDSLAYGISTDGHVLQALAEVVYTRRGGKDIGWLKLLTVKFAPEYAPFEVEGNAEKLEAVVLIYSAAIIETIRLTARHQARVVKLYGRDNTMLHVLLALKESLVQQLDNEKYSVVLEGRWLVIRAN